MKNGRRDVLEAMYRKYNHPRFIHPDPLEYVLRFQSDADREVVGLVASSLAYGNVKGIGSSVEKVLGALGPSPAERLSQLRREELNKHLSGFKHRWTTGDELADLLWGIGRLRERYGSLGACFTSHYSRRDENVLPALVAFVMALRNAGGGEKNSLLSKPLGGSACKRLHLFLRWMIRDDAVDPGCWKEVPPSKLIVPVDTHMHRVGLRLRLTRRRQAGLRTALDLTMGFRRIRPDDPVRYDFALTRPGIRRDPEGQVLLDRLPAA